MCVICAWVCVGVGVGGCGGEIIIVWDLGRTVCCVADMTCTLFHPPNTDCGMDQVCCARTQLHVQLSTSTAAVQECQVISSRKCSVSSHCCNISVVTSVLRHC